MAQRIHLKREPKLERKHEAFVYQEEAFHAVKELPYAAIFHEQGLGKTKIAIDLALYWLQEKKVDTVIVVVKKSLLNNWVREFDTHSYVKPKILSQNKKNNYFVLNSPARLILAHYEVFKSEKERLELFLKTRNVAAILDESTKIKNPDANLTQAFFDMASLFKMRVIMTGTPVANRPQDLWSQIWFLDQGASLGTDYSRFKNDVDLANDLSKSESAQRSFEAETSSIYSKIENFSVRETKASGVIELPSKKIQTTYADWEPYQYDLYRQIRDELRAVVVRDGILKEDETKGILKRLLRLVQVASNPILIDDNYRAEPGKMPPLIDLVESINRRGEKCIIWTSFTANVDWLHERLKRYGSKKIHGKMNVSTRNRAIDKFMNDEKILSLIATPGVAKEGLTLTVANNVIFFDRTFSLDDYLQSQDRIHRISQTRTCFVHNILMSDSIDEWVDVLLKSKEMAAKLAQGDISREYYQDHMSYDFGEILQKILQD